MFRTAMRSGRVARRSKALNLEVNRLEGRALLSTAPTTTAAVMGRAGMNGYYLGPVTVDLTASEPGVPASSLTTEYRVNNGSFTTGNEIQLNDSGTDVIQYFSKDAGGNVEATQTLTVKIDTTTPHLTEHATPTTLWPPNHKFDTVHVSGTATDSVSGINGGRVSFFVRDEYGQVQPRGSARVRANGTYSFNVQLQASRLGQDHDGRQYTIFVVAHSGSGRDAVRTAVVTVPHDQGHSRGNGSGSQGQGGDSQGDSGDNWGWQDQGGNSQGHGNHGHGHQKHGKGHGHG